MRAFQSQSIDFWQLITLKTTLSRRYFVDEFERSSGSNFLSSNKISG